MELLGDSALRIEPVRSALGSGFQEEEEDSSDSSIGVPDYSEEEDEEDAVVSSENGKLKMGSGSLGSLASLEDSLPVK